MTAFPNSWGMGNGVFEIGKHRIAQDGGSNFNKKEWPGKKKLF